MNHPAEHPSEGSKVILIVEDEADIADILIRTLQSETSYLPGFPMDCKP